MDADRLRWYAVGVAILTGAVLVAAGLIDGNAWVSLVGGMLTGGGTVAATKR